MNELAFTYCSSCENLEDCRKYHWVITMDKGHFIQGFNFVICDNYKKKEK